MDFALRYEIYFFFKGIADSFKPSPLEIILITLGVFFFIGVLIWVYRKQKNRAKAISMNYAQTLYLKSIKNISLPSEDLDLLNRIAEEHPAGVTKKYLVVQRASAFDEAAGKLIGAGELTEEETLPIREKLEEACFQEDHGIATTRDIPRGIHLYIMEDRSFGYHGDIKLKTPEALQIELRDNGLILDEESEITAYFKRNTDTFYFRATVKVSAPGILELSHPAKIRKVQRRKYYRTECRKSAVISHLNGKNRIPTTITDLGGGGATINNRGNKYKAGEGIFLYFKMPGHRELRIKGKVVRATREGLKLHVRFESLRERERDIIISYVFKNE